MDPYLIQKREDWGDIHGNKILISDPQLATRDPNFDDCEQVENVRKVGQQHMALVTGVWFKEAISGSHIRYPVTKSEVKYYQFYHSSAWVTFVNFSAIVQLLLPFFTAPVCSTNSNQNLFDFVQYYPAAGLVTILYIVGTFIQLYDFYCWMATNSHMGWQSDGGRLVQDYTARWQLVRVFCCVLILIDCIIFFASPRSSPLISRCLFPLVMITRRDTQKQIIEGFAFSFGQSLSILKILAFGIIAWGFVGFLLFQRVETNGSGDQHFSTLLKGVLTSLHCFASRPTGLFRIDQMAEVSGTSFFYFVILTLVADILFGTLLVAVGNRYYRDFRSLIYRTRLKYRKIALSALFRLYSDEESQNKMSLDNFTCFCQRLPSRYRIKDAAKAKRVFDLEDPDNTGYINERSFFRSCALISALIQFHSLPTENLSHVDESQSLVVFAAEPEAIPKPLQQVIVAIEAQSSRVKSDDAIELQDLSRRQPSARDLAPGSEESPTLWYGLFRRVCIDTKLKTKMIYYSNIIAGSFFVAFGKKIRFITVANVIMHLLLVVQLCFYSQRSFREAWTVVGWLLLTCFWLDTGVKYLSSRHSRLTTIRDTLVNTGALITKSIVLAMSTTVNGVTTANAAAITAVVLVQTLRSLKLFTLIPGSKSLKAIFPTLIRIFELIALIVYIFTIIGHVVFCNSLNPSEIPDVDDDAMNWLRFSHILNFSSYLQSAYTLAEVALLANWSMVMDAVLQTTPPFRSYMFFFLYRLAMTLTVLPMLMSFVIQAFMAQLNKSEQPVSKTDQSMLYEASSRKVIKNSVLSIWSGDDRETVRATFVPPIEQVANASKIVVKKYVELRSDITEQKTILDAAYACSGDQDQGAQRLQQFVVSDPRILHEMNRWKSLYKPIDVVSDAETGGIDSNMASTVNFEIPEECHGKLIDAWVSDAIKGRRLELPATVSQLYAYLFVRAEWVRSVVIVGVLVQVLLAFLLPSPCMAENDLNSSIPARYSFHNFTIRNVAIFNYLMVVFYTVDAIMELWVKSSTKNWRNLIKSWTAFRLFCCAAVLVDILIYFGMETTGRYLRAVFPLFVITREVNTRQMLHGLAISLSKSVIIYNLLFLILIVWSFLGYYLFQRYETHAHRFETLASSFKTCLHCFTSAPYALIALDPYFEIAKSFALYFLALTITLEVVGNALIIAIANNEFKKFADANLARRLDCRRNCVIAIWRLLCQSTSHMSRETFQELAIGLSGRYSMDETTADDLFSFMIARQNVNSDDSDSLTLESFYCLIGLISIRAKSASTTNEVKSTLHDKIKPRKPTITTTQIFISPPIATACYPYAQRLLGPAADVLVSLCHSIFSAEILVGNVRLGLFESFNFLMHLLLLVQLSMLASQGFVSVSWYNFGWFLEVYFILDMVVRMIVLGEIAFIDCPSHRSLFFVNLTSFIAMCFLDPSSLHKTTPALTLTVIFQCIRILRIGTVVLSLDQSKLVELRGTVGRVMLLLFAVLYFFSIVAQLQFCGTLDASNIDTASTDDDASIWPKFRNILNFSNDLHAMFTMFEMSVIGNWSMVMDAIAKTREKNATRSYFFFYTFRLLMTLVVYPLMLSFIIRSFIVLNDQAAAEASYQSAEDQLEEQAYDEIRESNVTFGDSDKLTRPIAKPKEYHLFKSKIAVNHVSTFIDLWSSDEKRFIEKNHHLNELALMIVNSEDEKRVQRLQRKLQGLQ